MGYQYELLQELAEHLEIKLDVMVSNDLDESFRLLMEGDCNLIAINLTITRERKKYVDFTEPHGQTRQVLVQRKPENWKNMGQDELGKKMIRNQLELAGKTIYIQNGSSYSERLRNLSDEIGDTIYIVECLTRPNKLFHLLQRVLLIIQFVMKCCSGESDLFPKHRCRNGNQFSAVYSMGSAKGATSLKREIDSWLIEFRKTTKYAVIYNKYFGMCDLRKW